jgi:hypothetical protein
LSCNVFVGILGSRPCGVIVGSRTGARHKLHPIVVHRPPPCGMRYQYNRVDRGRAWLTTGVLAACRWIRMGAQAAPPVHARSAHTHLPQPRHKSAARGPLTGTPGGSEAVARVLAQFRLFGGCCGACGGPAERRSWLVLTCPRQQSLRRDPPCGPASLEFAGFSPSRTERPVATGLLWSRLCLMQMYRMHMSARVRCGSCVGPRYQSAAKPALLLD